MEPSAERIIEWLELHGPTTCGFVSEPFRSDWQIPPTALPSGFDDSRSLGNVFYFLVTPAARVVLHRIRSDQMYHHYLGAALEVLLLFDDGRCELRRVGKELDAGERPQLLIPANTFHTARVADGGRYSLLGTSVWLRAEPADVELGNVEKIAEKFPAAARQFAEFCQ